MSDYRYITTHFRFSIRFIKFSFDGSHPHTILKSGDCFDLVNSLLEKYPYKTKFDGTSEDVGFANNIKALKMLKSQEDNPILSYLNIRVSRQKWILI